MISKEEVLQLAELARLRLEDEEVAALQKDISNILEYVGQVGAVAPQGGAFLSDSKGQPLSVRNVMREDAPRAEGDSLRDTEASLRAAFPVREGDYNQVRKIIQKDE